MSFAQTVPPPPIRDLPEDRYAILRAVFSQNSFDEETVLARLGAEAIADLFEGGYGERIDGAATDGLDALIHVFLLGRGMVRAKFASWLGEDFAVSCLEQGLLREISGQSRVFATVSIQPCPPENEGLWIVSDRVVPAPEAELPGGPELIYPTVTPSAQVFLKLLPRSVCGRFAEVCAGCGPAAVLAADFAGEIHAGDIDPRAVAFASYNARLNELAAFHGVTGSLYEGLAGAFDRIAAHPPYMPSDGPVEVYYGGGIDGTDLLRQLVSGLPGRLTPGGLFYAVAMLPESATLPVEARVRRWLGERAAGHDVFFFPLHERSLVQVAYEAAAKLSKGMEAVSHYRRTLLEMGHSGFVYGAILIRAHEGDERPIDIRRKLSPASTWRELLWCVDWETGLKQPSRMEQVLEEEVRATRALEVVVRHRAGEEGLEPVSFQAIARYPFEMESLIQGWMAMLLGQAAGGHSGRELLASAREMGLIQPETPEPEFARLLAMFVSGGFLESGLAPLPISRAREEEE